jgi:hypothetical protein
LFNKIDLASPILNFNTFSSGFIEGVLAAILGFSLAVLGSKSPLWNAQPESIFKYFPKVNRIIRPTSAVKHAWLKLFLIPLTLLLIAIQISFFLEEHNWIMASFLWLILIASWSIYSILPVNANKK